MEATTTLADALLDDLDDLMESDEEDQNDDNQNAEASFKEGDHDNGTGDGLSLEHKSNLSESSTVKGSEIGKSDTSQFLHNPALVKHMKIIRQHIALEDSTDKKAPPTTTRDSKQKQKEEKQETEKPKKKIIPKKTRKKNPGKKRKKKEKIRERGESRCQRKPVLRQ